MGITLTAEKWNKFMTDDDVWCSVYCRHAKIFIDDKEYNEYSMPQQAKCGSVVHVIEGNVYSLSNDTLLGTLPEYIRHWENKHRAASYVVEIEQDRINGVLATLRKIDGVKTVVRLLN